MMAQPLELGSPLDMVCLLRVMVSKVALILTGWTTNRCGPSSLQGEKWQGS